MISHPDDKYEQEADRVADGVMRLLEPSPPRQGVEAEKELLPSEPLVQRRAIADCGGSEVPPMMHEVLRSPGQPLEPQPRAFMESRFGHDFSHVRIHTDSQAAETAYSVNARAFTIGRDVVFGAGEYAPGTLSGNKLLAHELVHVLQQGGGGRTAISGGKTPPIITPRLTHRPILSRMQITRVDEDVPICGGHDVTWRLTLNNPAPCDGFMVQHVRMYERKNECPNPPPEQLFKKPADECWEAHWKVHAGDREDKDNTDTFGDRASLDSSGRRAVTGLIRFFCESTTGDLNELWTTKHSTCGSPATTTEPSWWRRGRAIDAGTHWVAIIWKCCGEGGLGWSKQVAKP
jgi:hypothetical protein